MHVTEEELKHKFVEAFNELIQNRKTIIDDCKTAYRLLCDTAEIDKRIAEAESERSLVEGIAMQAINNNQRHAVNQTEWMHHNEKYLKRYDELNELPERCAGSSFYLYDARSTRRIVLVNLILI